MASYRPSTGRVTPANHKPFISDAARQRPVRVIPADDRAEMEAGHLIGSGSAFSSNMTRPDRDAQEGFGPSIAFNDVNSGEPETDDSSNNSSGGSFGGFGDSSAAEEPR